MGRCPNVLDVISLSARVSGGFTPFATSKKWNDVNRPHPRGTDVWLLHDYDRKTNQETLLDRYQGLRHGEACGTIDEDRAGLGYSDLGDERILSGGPHIWQPESA
jgi:hypothetical protein